MGENVLMGGAMLSKSLIQLSVDGRGCVPSLLFDLRPNHGGGNEDNGDNAHKDFVCALQESISPVLCKFWQLYGGVDGNLLQEGLCHTQVCCNQSPGPCGRPLLTRTSTGDTQA